MTAHWTQPMCDGCWLDREGDRVPVRLRSPDRERCCMCGQETVSGIYVRINPSTVPYPQEVE